MNTDIKIETRPQSAPEKAAKAPVDRIAEPFS